MYFEDFKNLIHSLTISPLLATDAHLKMAPFERIAFLKDLNFDDKNPKKAGVLCLFYPKNVQTYLVLIVRNTYPGVHSSQISFPGGKFEETDKDLKETALRETFEEIGISSDKVNIIREMSEIYIPPSNFLVAPFIGYSNSELIFKPDSREVQKILEFSVDDLLNENRIIQTSMTTSYAKDISVPAFKVDEYIVWGATAMMLSEIKELLKLVLK
jgi:8-oxo-dGTP pyrophosphatase MutT (NUDIX family)